MRGKGILVVCLAIAAVALAVALLPGGAAEAQAPAPSTIVYNLYATDGYLELPDNEPGVYESATYIYGFVGSRAGQDFEYTTSFCTGNGITRNCVTPTNVAVPGGADAPQGGPRVGQDHDFAGQAQFPAPAVYATKGDVVEIRLKNLGVAANPNAPNDPHSIHLHGLDVDAANDGVPETSVGAVPANLCSDGVSVGQTHYSGEHPTNPGEPILGGDPVLSCDDWGGPAPGAGNVIVYMFSPEHPGTYMYHCHQEADIHVNMGMFGALVVYNPGDAAALTGPGMGQGGTLYDVQYDQDYILLLGEFDIRGHADEEGTYAPGGLVPPNTWDPDPYNWALYQPTYWFVNGLAFPNTLHVPFPSGYTYPEWLAAHPGYEPLITGSVSVPNAAWGTPGEKTLIRVINMGFETQPMHMHGYHGKVIGSDARAWDWTTSPKSKTNKMGIRPFGEGLEKNTLTIGSGETYDWLIDFGQQSFSSLYPDGSGNPRAADPNGPYPPNIFLGGDSPGGTETRFYDASTACDGDLTAAGVAFPAVNTPVSNTFVNCPAIPVDGDPGNLPPHDAPYVAGPEVVGLFEGLTPGATSQFFPFHNHDDYKATNNGVYPGGMFTMIVPTP